MAVVFTGCYRSKPFQTKHYASVVGGFCVCVYVVCVCVCWEGGGGGGWKEACGNSKGNSVQPPYNSHPWDSKKVAVEGR